MRSLGEHVPYPSASEVPFHEKALYQGYISLPVPFIGLETESPTMIQE